MDATKGLADARKLGGNRDEVAAVNAAFSWGISENCGRFIVECGAIALLSEGRGAAVGQQYCTAMLPPRGSAAFQSGAGRSALQIP